MRARRSVYAKSLLFSMYTWAFVQLAEACLVLLREEHVYGELLFMYPVMSLALADQSVRMGRTGRLRHGDKGCLSLSRLIVILPACVVTVVSYWVSKLFLGLALPLHISFVFLGVYVFISAGYTYLGRSRALKGGSQSVAESQPPAGADGEG